MKSFLAAILTFILATSAQSAEGVAWRSDYDKAVRESAETKKPLLLNFGNAGCVYCRKLDATTFRDPAVLRLMNERFVCVKIDGDRETKLVQTLQIDSYPTLIVAGSDGTVLRRHPGYLDVAGMSRFLQSALDKLPKSVERAPVVPAAGQEETPMILLLKAKKDLQEGFYYCCVERCDRLIRSFPQSQERAEARQVAEQAMKIGGGDIRDVFALLGRPR